MDIPEFALPFYVCHIAEGLVNYPEVGKMRLLREETLRKMDPTFVGKPVKFDIEHMTLADGEMIARAQRKGAYVDGVVVNSFFNENDGRHWCKVMVWDPDALEAIGKGIGVSNAYVMNDKGEAGEYHATPFDEEVLDGEYDHLLITDAPRYEESQSIGFLTPEQFQAYNESRKKQLLQVANKKEPSMKFFERKTSETIKGLEGVEVELTKSKKVVLIANVLNAVDEQMAAEEKGEMYANMDHKIKLFDNSICNVGELHEKYKSAMEENSRMKNELGAFEEATAEGHDEKKGVENKDEDPEEKKKREEEEKAENEKKDKEKDTAQNKRLEEIRNRVQKLKDGPNRFAAAHPDGMDDEDLQPVVQMSRDRVVNRTAETK